ncbi:MAG: DUF3313 domain-containing protein [Ottowia sp.]|nr:DUF3313 domain-containing protein [Ottowia sp.]
MIQINKKQFAKCVCITLFAIGSVWAIAQDVPDKDVDVSTSSYSGFLKDYSKLKKTIDSQGNIVLRWVDPAIKVHRYQKFIVKNVAFFPEAKPTKQVSSLALEDIPHYIESNLRERLAVRTLLAEAPGNDVLALRLAITAVMDTIAEL